MLPRSRPGSRRIAVWQRSAGRTGQTLPRTHGGDTQGATCPTTTTPGRFGRPRRNGVGHAHRLYESRRDKRGDRAGPQRFHRGVATRSEPATTVPTPTPPPHTGFRALSQQEAGPQPSPPIIPASRRGRGLLAAVVLAPSLRRGTRGAGGGWGRVLAVAHLRVRHRELAPHRREPAQPEEVEQGVRGLADRPRARRVAPRAARGAAALPRNGITSALLRRPSSSSPRSSRIAHCSGCV